MGRVSDIWDTLRKSGSRKEEPIENLWVAGKVMNSNGVILTWLKEGFTLQRCLSKQAELYVRGQKAIRLDGLGSMMVFARCYWKLRITHLMGGLRISS